MENQDQTATIEKNNLLYYKQNKPHLLSRGDFWRIAESEAFLSNLPETRFDGYWPLYLSDYLLEEKTRKIFQPSLSSVTSDLPKSESKYLLGKMVTGAMTTSSAIGWIASATGVARSDITVASHKDSSSISAQLICLPRIAAEKLKETVLPQGLLMGKWQPTDSTLSSSDFAGNRHMVAVRTESEVDLTAFSIKIDMITKYGFL
ncbi:tRNA pseudouridine(13) synthase TruD, partial [Candidatus Falkowbacteria bacterium]|nr:tRNA pseudouridine(13) synthase TruD [Candidatus Falkowbacteria bacterium]